MTINKMDGRPFLSFSVCLHSSALPSIPMLSDSHQREMIQRRRFHPVDCTQFIPMGTPASDRQGLDGWSLIWNVPFSSRWMA